MMGLEFTGQIPFSDVYVHSIIQAPDGRRMSKSLGTGIDPLDLIDGGPRPPVFADGAGDFPAYGADAVRWGLLAMSSGQDVRFNEDKIAQGQQLTNKLWNAARLILLGSSIERAARPTRVPQPTRRGPLDPVAARAGRGRSRRADRRFDFSHAALGALRLRLRRAVRLVPGAGQAAPVRRRAATRATLLHVLTETVALAHPLIPFVTEEIYRYIPGAEGLLAARVCRRRVRRRASTQPPRRAWSARSRRSRRSAPGATRPTSSRRRRSRRGWPPTATSETAEHLARLAPLALTRGWRRRRSRWRRVPDPRRRRRDPRRRRRRPRGRRAQARAPARRARGRDRARRAQARQRRLRRQGAAEVVQAERDKLERAAGGAGGAVRPPEEAERDCCRSSCSGCGSGWTACAG